LSDEIQLIGNPDLRERMDGYAREIRAQLQHLGRTVDYFTRERQIVERLRQEREATVFYPHTVDDLFSAYQGTDIEGWFERINGRVMRSDMIIDVRTTVHLEGWMVSPGIVPDAENTARFILLKNVTGGEVYAAPVYQYWARQDVVGARSHLDASYTANSGFGSLFSLSKVPPGTYQLGCGIKNSIKAAHAWSDYRVQLLSTDRRRGGSRDPGRKRRSVERQDA
jgi:hypothetical protein